MGKANSSKAAKAKEPHTKGVAGDAGCGMPKPQNKRKATHTKNNTHPEKRPGKNGLQNRHTYIVPCGLVEIVMDLRVRYRRGGKKQPKGKFKQELTLPLISGLEIGGLDARFGTFPSGFKRN